MADDDRHAPDLDVGSMIDSSALREDGLACCLLWLGAPKQGGGSLLA
jgi:hypothetical protein